MSINPFIDGFLATHHETRGFYEVIIEHLYYWFTLDHKLALGHRKTKTLELGAEILQTDQPVDAMEIYLQGFYPLKDDPQK